MRDKDTETNKYGDLVTFFFGGGYAEQLFDEFWKVIENSPLDENVRSVLKGKTLKQIESILNTNNYLNAIGLTLLFNGFYYYAFEDAYDVGDSYFEIVPKSFDDLDVLLDLKMCSTKNFEFKRIFYEQAIKEINDEWGDPDPEDSSFSALDDYELFYETKEDEIKEIISSLADAKAYECLQCLKKAFGDEMLFCLFYALGANVKEYLYGDEEWYLAAHIKDEDDEKEHDRVLQEYLDLEVTVDKIKEDYEDIWRFMPCTFALQDAWSYLQCERGFSPSYY